jgi:hypothetical protein
MEETPLPPREIEPPFSMKIRASNQREDAARPKKVHGAKLRSKTARPW